MYSEVMSVFIGKQWGMEAGEEWWMEGNYEEEEDSEGKEDIEADIWRDRVV